MIYYGIRHKATGELMPQAKRARGYSHWNPSNPEGKFIGELGIPRLIQSRGQAHRIIVQWAANPNASIGYSVSYEGTEDYSVDIKPDGRKKEDLEIVELHIKVK